MQTFKSAKGGMDRNITLVTIITLLSTTSRTFRQKVSKETVAPNKNIDEVVLRNIQIISLNSNTIKNIAFQVCKLDNMLGNK